VAREVLDQVRAGQEAVLGLLLESHLRPGRQDWIPGKALAYGTSITDACIGWDETEALLHEVAETVRARAGRDAPR
jgi:3-deoxy-7-phosphoheptulonate synthase